MGGGKYGEDGAVITLDIRHSIVTTCQVSCTHFNCNSCHEMLRTVLSSRYYYYFFKIFMSEAKILRSKLNLSVPPSQYRANPTLKLRSLEQ